MKTIFIVSLLVCATLAGSCFEDCRKICKSKGITAEATVWKTCQVKCQQQKLGDFDFLVNKRAEQCMADCTGTERDPVDWHSCRFDCRQRIKPNVRQIIFEPQRLVQKFSDCWYDCDESKKAAGQTNEAIIWHSCNYICEQYQNTNTRVINFEQPIDIERFEGCFNNCNVVLKEQGITNEATLWRHCHLYCGYRGDNILGQTNDKPKAKARKFADKVNKLAIKAKEAFEKVKQGVDAVTEYISNLQK